MKINLAEFEADMDEEVDIYSINNSLDDETTNELRFVISSFAKYYKKMISSNPKEDFLTIINNFDITLETISSGILGTSFKTNAPVIYKNLPTIKAMMEDTIKKLEDEINALKVQNNQLERKNRTLSRKCEDLQNELDEAKAKISVLTLTKSSSRSGGSSYDSYGGCSGGRSSYGRC